MSIVNPFIVGTTTRITTGIIGLSNNLPADPTGLALKIREPDKTLTTLTFGVDNALVKDSVGNYHADVLLDQSGVWHWRWEASGANSGVAEGTLTVLASKVL